jgi:hypothetical protein
MMMGINESQIPNDVRADAVAGIKNLCAILCARHPGVSHTTIATALVHAADGHLLADVRGEECR